MKDIIENFENLKTNIEGNGFICQNKFIQITDIEFREVLKLNTGRMRNLKFENCDIEIKKTDFRKPQIGISNNIFFKTCVFVDDLCLEEIVFTNTEISFSECNFLKNIYFLNIVQSGYNNFISKVIFENNFHNNNEMSFNSYKSEKVIVFKFDFFEKNIPSKISFADFKKLEVQHISNKELKILSFFRIESLILNLSSVIDTLKIEETNLDSIRDHFQIKNFVLDKSKLSGSFIPEKSHEIQSIKSTKSDFKNIIDLTGYSINELDFEDCIFQENFLLIKCVLSNIDFVNCSFEKTLKIVDFKVEISKANFHRSTVKKFLFFNGFDEEIVKTTKECKIDFSYVFIQPTGHVIIRNVNKDNGFCGEIDFSYANILGAVTLQDSQFRTLNMQKSTIVGQFNKENVLIEEYSNRATLVRIKNEFNKKNDKVKALEYKAKEFEKYLVEIDYPLVKIISKFISNFTKIKAKNIDAIVSIILLPLLLLMSLLPFHYFATTREYTLLFFNRISNSFGISWARGVIFTMITAFAFYLLINYCGTDSQLFEFGWEGWKNFGGVWKGFLNILNIFNLNNQKIGMELNAFGETLFFLSKIFITFGVYQTIAAFRKYGK